MNKFKKILLLVLLLLATGCEGVYNVEIYNDTCKEDATIIEKDSSSWDSVNEQGATFRSLLDEEFDRDNYYYKKTMISNDEELGLNYKGEFLLTEYESSGIIYRCYDYFRVIEEEGSILMSTSNKNLCFDNYEWLDNLTINVKTNHKVLNNNADKTSNNVYTWYLNRYDNNKSIQIELSKDEYVLNYDNEIMKNILIVLAGVGVIILFVGTIAIWFYIKNKRVNKI